MWNDLPKEVDQIWAEVYTYWALGEELFLSKEVEALAFEQQESHRETSGKEGIILDFLEKKIPSNWDQMDLGARRMFLAGGNHGDVELVPRDKVCAVEVWVECFGGDQKYMKRQESTEINNILNTAKGWKRNKSARRYGPYGIQRGFEKV